MCVHSYLRWAMLLCAQTCKFTCQLVPHMSTLPNHLCLVTHSFYLTRLKSNQVLGFFPPCCTALARCTRLPREPFSGPTTGSSAAWICAVYKAPQAGCAGTLRNDNGACHGIHPIHPNRGLSLRRSASTPCGEVITECAVLEHAHVRQTQSYTHTPYA